MSAYAIHVAHYPESDGDPIPWSWAVWDGTVRIGGGWSGTEAEAREHAQEWLDALATDEGDECPA